MVCMIIRLVKRLLIKLGWLKPSAADTGCGIPSQRATTMRNGGMNDRQAVEDWASEHTRVV